MRPASAGPAKKPMLSIVEEATFAAASSIGSRASCGRRDAWLDRNGDPQMPVTMARA
jgi:hypothetical protein